MRRLSGLVLTLALPIFWAAPAHATNYTMYSGASCVPKYGSTSTAYTAGWIENLSSSTSQYVYCPVDRDETTTTSFGVTAYVYNYSTASPVSCMLYAISPTTGSGWYSSSANTSTSSGYQSMTLSAITSSSGYREYMYCTLSGAVSYANGVVGYYVSE